MIGDFVLGRGYAYASTDKGNTGTSFYDDGAEPGDAIAEWNRRVTELTLAAKEVVAPALRPRAGAHLRDRHLQRRLPDALAAREPARPLRRRRRLGGHAVRRRAGAEPAHATCRPALKHYPRYRATGDQAAHDAMIAAGFAPGSEFLWDDHYAVYWDLTQRTYREELDPELRRRDRRRASRSASPARRTATPTTTTPRAPAAGARRRSRKVAQHGPDRQADAHAARHARHAAADPRRLRRLRAQGRAPRARGALHRYYVIEAATTSTAATTPSRDRLRPMLPVPPHGVRRARALGRAGRGAAATASSSRSPRGGDVVNALRRCAPAASAGGGPTRARRPARAARAGALRRDASRRGATAARPYRFRTRGRLRAPGRRDAPPPAAAARSTVQVKAGRRTISARRARLRRDCRFSLARDVPRAPRAARPRAAEVRRALLRQPRRRAGLGADRARARRGQAAASARLTSASRSAAVGGGTVGSSRWASARSTGEGSCEALARPGGRRALGPPHAVGRPRPRAARREHGLGVVAAVGPVPAERGADRVRDLRARQVREHVAARRAGERDPVRAPDRQVEHEPEARLLRRRRRRGAAPSAGPC